MHSVSKVWEPLVCIIDVFSAINFELVFSLSKLKCLIFSTKYQIVIKVRNNPTKSLPSIIKRFLIKIKTNNFKRKYL